MMAMSLSQFRERVIHTRQTSGLTRSTVRRRSHVATVVVVLIAMVIAGCAADHGAGGGGSSESASGSSDRLARGSSSHTIDFHGVTRSYRTYVPASVGPSEPVPMVMMLHGGFGSDEQAERDYGWDSKADSEGFIVVYPNGQGRAWNAGTCCGSPAKDDVDDVGFITKVVEQVQGRSHIDPSRIFVTGMSNGAMMAERLACETDLFAAAASVAGAQMVPCDDPAPISVLHIHGATDSSVPMDGSPGDGKGHVPDHEAIQASFDRWLQVDDCGEPTTRIDGEVTSQTATCAEQRAVELITVAGAGHQWPGSVKKRPGLSKLLGIDEPSDAMNATDVIWQFFAAHSKSD